MRKTLKILSIALAATMLIALCAVFFASNTEVDAVDVKDGGFATKAGGGTDYDHFVFGDETCDIDKTDTGAGFYGSITTKAGEKYYLIGTQSHYDKLSGVTSGKYIICQDITITPKNYTVSGITIEGCGKTITMDGTNAKIFNEVKNNSTINNLKIAGTTAASASLANKFTGTMNYVINYATVTGTHSGGIVNQTGGTCTFNYCENRGSVTGTSQTGANNSYTGGIIAMANQNVTMTGCKNSGTVTEIVPSGTTNKVSSAGGLVGRINSGKTLTLNNCENNGTVVSDLCAGGLVGLVDSASTKLVIKGCTTSADATVTGRDAGGFLGYANAGASVQITNNGDKASVNNSTVTAVDVKPWSTSGNTNYSERYGESAGGFIGYSKIAITIDGNSVNNGTITGTTSAVSGKGPQASGFIGYLNASGKTVSITNSTNNGTITAALQNVAGFIAHGTADVTIDGCVNTGAISANGNSAGGITGYVSGGTFTVINCVNGDADDADKGAVTNTNGAAGGITGKSHTNITWTNCTNYGSVESDGNNENAAGGIVGCARNSATATITDCENNGAVTVTNQAGYVGGILGSYARNNIVVNITGCTNNGTVTLAAKLQSYAAAGGITAGPAVYNLLYSNANMNPVVTITDCVNNGDLVSKADSTTTVASDLAGILARTGSALTEYVKVVEEEEVTVPTTTTTIVIENCVNTGDCIDSNPNASSAAGIVARIQVTEENSSVTITNCYSTGAFDLASGKGANALGNDLAESNVTVSNYFYLNGTDSDFAESTEQVSEAAMAGGYVAYKLGWGQKIGVDVAPVLGSTDTVYAVALKATAEGEALATTYSNTDADKIIALAHAGVQKREDVTGYRVLTSINAYDYELLKAADVQFQLGTLITADKYGVSTYEELQAAGKPCIIVTAIDGAWYDTTDSANTFAGSLLQIKEANRDMDYAVRGYIEIDGTIIYTDEVVVCYNDLVA